MSLQAIFKHKANAEEGIAPALFDPTSVETFEAKQKRAEQDTYAAISNSHGEASVSNSLVSARIRDMTQGIESENVKKRKARESMLVESLKTLNDILDQMEQATLEAQEISDRIVERDLDKEAFAAALAVDSLDDLDEDQKSRVIRAIDEYSKSTGRKIDPNNKDDWAVAVEMMDFRNDLALMEDREAFKHTLDRIDKLEEDYNAALIEEQDVNLNDLDEVRERKRSIKQQREALNGAASDEFGVDAEVELFVKTLAQLHQKHGDAVSAENVTHRIDMLSQEAQQAVMELEEVQNILEREQQSEIDTNQPVKPVEQSSSLNMLSSF